MLIDIYDHMVNLEPYYTYYRDNNRLAIVLYDVDTKEDYAELTVNLPDAKVYNKNQAYVDTNNCTWAIEYIKRSGIGKPLSDFSVSGFCIYPLFEFNLERMKKYND